MTDELIDRTERQMVFGKKDIDLTTASGLTLAHMFAPLTHLTWHGDDAYEPEDVLIGTLHVFGVGHFVTLVRVHRDVEGMLVGTNDPHNRLEDVLAGADEGSPQTIELPGFEGEWVLGVDPHR